MTSICEYLEAAADLSRTRIALYPAYQKVEIAYNWHAVGRGDASSSDLEIIEARLTRLAYVWTHAWTNFAAYGNTATFYAWYDKLEGRLQFCMTSRPQSDLPFGATIALLDSPRPVIQQLLDDPQPGSISWSDLTEVEDDDTEPEIAYVLPVWASTHTW